MTVRRTAPRALYAALEQGDLPVLFTDSDPRLIGRTEDGEEVWEIVGIVATSPSSRPVRVPAVAGI